MCWKIDNKEFDRDSKKYHKKADKDLYVYKYGDVSKDGNIFHPHFEYRFSYKPNVLNDEIDLFPINLHSTCYIDEGYHSYDTKRLFWNASHVGKFIIPKGSEYFINEDGEIASSNIIWTGEYEENKTDKIINKLCVGVVLIRMK